MHTHALPTRQLSRGAAHGPVLFTNTALSFWGGVNPATGEVIDRHHPLSGQSVTGKMLVMPQGRGSCTGSSVLLELILNGKGPAALVLQEPDEILLLGAVIAECVFAHQLPVVTVTADDFKQLAETPWASLSARGELTLQAQADPLWCDDGLALPDAIVHGFSAMALTPQDRAILAGAEGKCRQVALQIVLRMAELQGVTELIDVVQAHIDGCIYTGSASLRFAAQLRDWGGKVKVPTTLNSISVDRRRWRALGVPPAFGEPASALAQAYVDMGASPTYTCAPYLLDSAPVAGEHIVWAESNAVVFANSVLGACTAKYADFMDICVALVGRAPRSGCHLPGNRFATARIDLPTLSGLDDAFFPLLGYWVGLLAGHRIPLICGLENTPVSRDDLKAFGAAFATTASAPMFHIAGVTPEATTPEMALGAKAPQTTYQITHHDLAEAWGQLNSASTGQVDLVALGNPHFSASECAALALLCKDRKRHAETAVVLTTSRAVYAEAERQGHVAALEAFGVNLLTDTCWCMLDEPVVPPTAHVIMTNSGKYAHYAPGLTGRQIHFGALQACVEAACTGQAPSARPAWLTSFAPHHPPGVQTHV